MQPAFSSKSSAILASAASATGRTAYVVLGAAGAGKSTYINRLVGDEVSRVSHRISQDGTVGVRTFLCGESVVYIDTPGLDSVNASTTGTKLGAALEQAGADTVVAILVVNKTIDRITTWIDKFFELWNEFVLPTSPRFVEIVWTRPGRIDPAKSEDLREKLQEQGFNCRQIDAEASTARSRPHVEAVRVVRVPCPPRKPVRAPTGPASQLQLALKLDLPGDPKKYKQKMKNLVSAHATELFELHRNGSSEFRDFKLFGDAVLELHVFAHLRYKGHSGNLKDLSAPFLSNKENGALARFFRQQLAELYSKHHHQAGSQVPAFSSDTCADFVEALLGKLLLGKKAGKAYNLIAVELLRLGHESAVDWDTDAAEAKAVEEEKSQHT